jgi:DNA-3-methyladenine glycosylase
MSRARTSELLAVLARHPWEVAPLLLGWTISRTSDAGTVTMRLTEVEAYAGPADPASHAFRGRTARNEVMFGPAGRLYVYRSYGVHWAMNVVPGAEGDASAVLLRAGVVVEGVDLARSRRGATVADRALARGPGNLGQTLGVTGDDTGTDLLGASTIRLRQGDEPGTTSCGPRVGVTKAYDVPWRFWVTDDPTVSAYLRSPRIR